VKPGSAAADVALYQGADRLQKIIAGAKKEGVLNIYTSAQTTDNDRRAGHDKAGAPREPGATP